MDDPTVLPPGLPEPRDDGSADHLIGLPLPDISLRAHDGSTFRLDDAPMRYLVLYVYPRTGGATVDLPSDWDLIPGARGCTPQSCAFRDHHSELAALDATVWGVSAQPGAEQARFAARMHIPFPLLNDSTHTLANPPLSLPTFDGGGLTLYRRITLIADRGTIAKVFYPVFPPDRNAVDVIEWLAGV